MEPHTTEFLNRIFQNNKTKWWANLNSETPKDKYRQNGRFLQKTLEEELSDVSEYRGSDRKLFFFSTSNNS